MGFSISGLLIAAIIFAPNLVIIVFPPKNIPLELKDAGILFTILERIGQIGCIILLCISKDNFSTLSINIWFVLMTICILAYYYLWLRYIIKGQDFSLLFKPLAFIPIPMAIFPVLAFAMAAILGQSIWLILAVLSLAIGHIPNSWHTYKSITK